jgi:hypothetical protein
MRSRSDRTEHFDVTDWVRNNTFERKCESSPTISLAQTSQAFFMNPATVISDLQWKVIEVNVAFDGCACWNKWAKPPTVFRIQYSYQHRYLRCSTASRQSNSERTVQNQFLYDFTDVSYAEFRANSFGKHVRLRTKHANARRTGATKLTRDCQLMLTLRTF